jgi:hypothetical protein
MVILIGLEILYSFLYINHFAFLISSFYPSSLICDLPLVWPVFHNIAVSVLGLYSTYETEHVAFGLLSLDNFT